MRRSLQVRNAEKRTRALGIAALAVVGLTLNGAGGIGAVRQGKFALEESARKDLRDIQSFTFRIEDLAARVEVTKYVPDALEKVGPDFKRTYALRNLTFQYKQPNKIRMEGKSAVLGSATLIMNGTKLYYSVPKLRLKKTEDLERSPSRRQSLLEYGGLLSPETLRFMEAKYVHEEMLDGLPMSIFDLTYKGVESGSHFRVWFDQKTRIARKRVWLDRDNRSRATFSYEEPKEIGSGIWLPTRIEIKNADGEIGATTSFHDVKLNQGVSESVFAILQ